jgi:hypothetical protein
MKSRFRKGCLLLVLLLLTGGGYVYWRAKTPPKVGEDFKTLSPQEQQRRREEARLTVENVEQVTRKIKSGDKSSFRLPFSEEVLNTLLQDRINTDKFPIHDLRIGLADGQLALQGIIPYKGANVTATLTGSVAAQDGKIVYKADSLIFNGLLPAPKKWRKKAEEEIGKGLNKLLARQEIDITSVAIENKQLVIEGTPR